MTMPRMGAMILATTVCLVGDHSGVGGAAERNEAIVAILWHDSPNDLKALQGVKTGLEALGMLERLRVEELRQDEARAKETLERVERDGAALVLALGTQAATLAKKHLRTTPMVFTAVTNPVLSGIVTDWAGSGTTIAGNSNWLDRRAMLESFRQALPDLKRLGVLTTRDCAVSEAEVAEATDVTRTMTDIRIVHERLAGIDDLERGLSRLLVGVDALWVPIDFALYQREPLARIVSAALKARIPVVSSSERCAGEGALIVVAVDYEILGLRAAALVKSILVDRVFPGGLPVGRLTGSRTYVDVGAARRLGRVVPLDVILKAHRLFDGD